MKLQKISFLIAFIITHTIFSQITITGKIVDNDQNVIVGANVHLHKKNNLIKGTATNKDGLFSINAKVDTNYQLQVSFIGFETKVINLQTLKENINLNTVILQESNEQLQSVEITGRKRKDYISDYSFSATKVAVKNKELPQSVATVTKELIDDKLAFQLTDAVKGISGVTPVSFYNHFNIRGITQNEDGQIINGMRTRQYYFLQPLTQNIERVEVVKGPSSVTFSSADPGGSINMVTKKPLTEKRHEINFATGSFSTIRGGLDFTGPLNEDKTLLYRLNAAVQEAKSFRDLVKNNALLISPSFSYVPNNKTAVNVEMIYSNNEGNLDRGQPIFNEITGFSDLKSTPITRNIAASNDFFSSKELIMTTSLSHRFSDKIQFNGMYMKQTWKEDLQEHRANGFITDVDGNTIDNLVRLRYAERKQFWDTDNLNAYFTFDIDFGKYNNKLVVGYDFNQLDKLKGGGQNGARGYVVDENGDTETIEYNGIEILKPKAGFFDLNNPSNIVRNVNAYDTSAFAIPSQILTTHAAYIQNVTKFENFTLLFSLRNEWFKDRLNYDMPNEVVYNNTALIPRVGLSYEINKKISVYGTYLEGFQPQMNTVSLMPITANNFFWGSDSPSQFDPLESSLIEFGAKASLFNGAVQTSIAAYQIKQNNILMQVPDEDADLGFTYNQRGSDRSRGFELDFSGYILPNLQISAACSYIDAIIAEDENEALIGQRKEATPEHSGSIWAKYDFKKSSILPGVSLGAGAIYSGDKLGWYDRNLALPSYTVFDTAVYYKPYASNLEFTFKLNNVFDTTYWTGAINNTRLFPGTPRNFMISTAYKF